VIEIVEAENRVRAKTDKGYISLLNTENGFRWCVRLADKAGGGKGNAPSAWKSSFDRCKEADEDFESNGVPECANRCGQPRFGRYPTCCTHCKGADGPHAHTCVPKGYPDCANGCGHSAFGKYPTCCTHCKGGDGPHARGCKSKATEKETCGEKPMPAPPPPSEGNSGAGRGKFRQTGPSCASGCGRQPFRRFPTCCTHCKGGDGPHHRDCDQREADEGVRRNIRNVFYQAKDGPSGISHKRFRQLLQKLFPSDSLEEMITACDKNGNGTIEIEEFMDWMWSSSVTEDDRQELTRGGN